MGQSIPVEMSNIPWELSSTATSMSREEDVHLQTVSSEVAAHVRRGIKFPEDCVKQFKEFKIKTEGGWSIFGGQRKQQEESKRGDKCGWQMQPASGVTQRRGAGMLTMQGEGRGCHSQRCRHPLTSPPHPQWRHHITLCDVTLPLVTSPHHPLWRHPLLSGEQAGGWGWGQLVPFFAHL